MRLLLDAHISGRRIARALREQGHDVRAADEERALDEVDDEALLALATADDRILVTANARDFLPLVTAWAEAGRQHAGVIVVARSIRQHQFGAIIVGVSEALTAIPDQAVWRDRVHWLSRHT
jgi:predicted nuclease of predicted toxin-antitoxin system